MTEKELRKMSRAELLQMLVLQAGENEKLNRSLEETQSTLGSKIRELEAKLADREIKIGESGTMAEAALKLNAVFEAADNAVAQYQENVQQMYKNQELAVKAVLADAQKQAEAIVAQAQAQAEAEKKKAEQYCRDISMQPETFDNERKGMRETPDLAGAKKLI